MTDKAERLWVVAVATIGALMCAVAALVTVGGSESRFDGVEAVLRALSVGLPIAVGLYARTITGFRRFGTLLVAAGAGWFLSTLAGSQDELLYSIGRVTGWIADVGLLYVLLTFPTGRLGGRGEERLVVAGLLLVTVLWVPTALLVESYPLPAVYGSCVSNCPGNAFMLAGSEPAWVDDVVRPLRELLTFFVFGGAALLLARRIRRASHVMRRTLAPVLTVAAIRWAALALALLARRIDPGSEIVRTLVWINVIALPALALAFLIGLVRWRLFIAAAMEQLARRMSSHPGPDEVRDALAEAFDDPGLEVVYRLQEPSPHWGDSDGRPVDAAALAAGRSFTEITDGDHRVAAVIYDPALENDPAFIASASTYAVMTLDNQRLSAQTAMLLTEVRHSRARIQAAADDERRRIENDLHDGAQQRLVALRIKLELAAEAADGNGGASAALLRSLGAEIDEAVDEVRSLARGIYPAPLEARGLVEALRSAALQAALPATVLAPAGLPRWSREIERAAYFVCLEAMQNTAKHATGAVALVIELSLTDALVIEVRDNGAGFDPLRAPTGMGITSMRDRLAAVGGSLAVRSAPGHGTVVTATIPVPAAAERAARLGAG